MNDDYLNQKTLTGADTYARNNDNTLKIPELDNAIKLSNENNTDAKSLRRLDQKRRKLAIDEFIASGKSRSQIERFAKANGRRLTGAQRRKVAIADAIAKGIPVLSRKKSGQLQSLRIAQNIARKEAQRKKRQNQNAKNLTWDIEDRYNKQSKSSLFSHRSDNPDYSDDGNPRSYDQRDNRSRDLLDPYYENARIDKSLTLSNVNRYKQSEYSLFSYRSDNPDYSDDRDRRLYGERDNKSRDLYEDPYYDAAGPSHSNPDDRRNIAQYRSDSHPYINRDYSYTENSHSHREECNDQNTSPDRHERYRRERSRSPLYTIREQYSTTLRSRSPEYGGDRDGYTISSDRYAFRERMHEHNYPNIETRQYFTSRDRSRSLSPLQRDTDSSYRRNRDSLYRRNRDSRYQRIRNSPDRPNRNSPYPSNRDSAYQRDTESPCRRNTDSPYRRNIDSPYGRRTVSPCRRNVNSPYRRDAISPCRRNADSPYRRNIDSPYRRDTVSPYRRDTDSAYRRDIDPYSRTGRSGLYESSYGPDKNRESYERSHSPTYHQNINRYNDRGSRSNSISNWESRTDSYSYAELQSSPDHVSDDETSSGEESQDSHSYDERHEISYYSENDIRTSIGRTQHYVSHNDSGLNERRDEIVKIIASKVAEESAIIPPSLTDLIFPRYKASFSSVKEPINILLDAPMYQEDASIKFAIVPVSFPNTAFTKMQTEWLIKFINFYKQPEKGETSPRIEEVIPHDGVLLVTCGNLKTKVWLEKVVATMQPWGNCQIRPASLDELAEKPIRATLLVPDPVPAKTPRLLFDMIKANNAGLNTQNWKILDINEFRNGIKVLVTLDKQSLENLQKKDMQLSLGTSKAVMTLCMG